jgi:hypothetical protein
LGCRQIEASIGDCRGIVAGASPRKRRSILRRRLVGFLQVERDIAGMT